MLITSATTACSARCAFIYLYGAFKTPRNSNNFRLTQSPPTNFEHTAFMLHKQISRVEIYIYMVGKIKITDHMLVIFCFPTLVRRTLALSGAAFRSSWDFCESGGNMWRRLDDQHLSWLKKTWVKISSYYCKISAWYPKISNYVPNFKESDRQTNKKI